MSRNPALTTAACRLFGVELPIVQTGMGWVSGASLTSATAAAGGLGIVASATLQLAELDAVIGKVQERTDRPFGVNLLPSQPDLVERLELMSRRGVSIASFAGAPSADTVGRLKDLGITSIVTVGARRHAEKMASLGVDALIAQGGEGGGHTGSVPTSLLLPAVAEAVAGSGVVVLGAGGFYDGRGLVAAMAYGADGIAMGTRFLLTRESRVPDHVKAAYLETPVTGTVVTSAIDGAPQRVIRTPFIDRLESTPAPVRFPRAALNAIRFRRDSAMSVRDLLGAARDMRKNGGLTLAQIAMAANAPMMTKATVVDGDIDAGILPTGQVVGEIGELPSVAELLESIVRDAEAVLERLGSGASATE